MELGAALVGIRRRRLWARVRFGSGDGVSCTSELAAHEAMRTICESPLSRGQWATSNTLHTVHMFTLEEDRTFMPVTQVGFPEASLEQRMPLFATYDYNRA